MPPHSTSLDQEGAAFISFKLVSKGEYQQESLKKQLLDAGSRNLHDNLADLQAQVAANQRVIPPHFMWNNNNQLGGVNLFLRVFS